MTKIKETAEKALHKINTDNRWNAITGMTIAVAVSVGAPILGAKIAEKIHE